MSILSPLLAFGVTLAALLGLSRWISRQVQTVAFRLTGSERAALIGYFLLLLPGILLHELSHALVARALGLKVGRLSLGPRPRGRYVELGSVQVSSGGVLHDSLVGLAPLLAGTAVLLLIGWQVFDISLFGRAWARGWEIGVQAVARMGRVPDVWLWAYLVFTVSNAMTPSPSDRSPWGIAAIYVGLALAAAYLLGGLAIVSPAMTVWVAGALQMLTLAFAFTLGLDLLVAALLVVIEALIPRPR